MSVSSIPCITSVGGISCAATSAFHPYAEKVGDAAPRRMGGICAAPAASDDIVVHQLSPRVVGAALDSVARAHRIALGIPLG
jgi:hypothetical protein